jgi:hypothetical protein
VKPARSLGGRVDVQLAAEVDAKVDVAGGPASGRRSDAAGFVEVEYGRADMAIVHWWWWLLYRGLA